MVGRLTERIKRRAKAAVTGGRGAGSARRRLVNASDDNVPRTIRELREQEELEKELRRRERIREIERSGHVGVPFDATADPAMPTRDLEAFGMADGSGVQAGLSGGLGGLTGVGAGLAGNPSGSTGSVGPSFEATMAVADSGGGSWGFDPMAMDGGALAVDGGLSFGGGW